MIYVYIFILWPYCHHKVTLIKKLLSLILIILYQSNFCDEFQMSEETLPGMKYVFRLCSKNLFIYLLFDICLRDFKLKISSQVFMADIEERCISQKTFLTCCRATCGKTAICKTFTSLQAVYINFFFRLNASPKKLCLHWNYYFLFVCLFFSWYLM